MRKSLLLLVVGAALPFASAVSAQAVKRDIRGLAIGMPLREAAAALKAAGCEQMTSRLFGEIAAPEQKQVSCQASNHQYLDLASTAHLPDKPLHTIGLEFCSSEGLKAVLASVSKAYNIPESASNRLNSVQGYILEPGLHIIVVAKSPPDPKCPPGVAGYGLALTSIKLYQEDKAAEAAVEAQRIERARTPRF